jgi:iron complex transport system substrate-binding protein
MHRITSVVYVFVIVLAALVLSIGCSSAATPAVTTVTKQATSPTSLPPPTVAPTSLPKPTETPSSAAGTPIKVTDAAGRTVELSKIPQRIVVVGRGPYMALHLVYMFAEGRERLVGMEKKGTSTSDFLPLVDKDFANKKVLESPGPEQVAALQPDLVLIKNPVIEQMGTALTQVHIPVVYLGLETPDQFYQDVTNMGLLLGNSTRAKEIIDFYQGRIARIRKGWEGIKESDKPTALLLDYSNRSGPIAVQVPAKAWMQTLEVQTAGGNPVWLDAATVTDGWTITNFEQIARWDPDKIFLVIWYTLDPKQVIASLKTDPKWSALKAAKTSQIYAFPSDIYGWDSPEPRWILGMTWLATVMYPDRFKDINMTDEIYQVLGKLYGMDKSNIDANILPKVRLNVH